MDLLKFWKQKLTEIDNRNDYIQQLVKTGRNLGRMGAVYNLETKETSLSASVSDKNEKFDVSVKNDGACICNCSDSSFCEHIVAVFFYAERMLNSGKMSELFRVWKETVKSVGENKSDNSEGNPLYTERINKMKNAVISLEKESTLKCTLRPYQQEGLKWLVNLYQHNIGALLADDMGLGKTIQTIGFFNEISDAEKLSLIVMPTSLLANWEKEFEKFAPHLKVYIHYGTERETESFKPYQSAYDIVLTTYTTLTNDEVLFKNMKWSVVCLDEGQNIKNAQTKRSKIIRSLKSEGRIALSGTPIENRLLELWALSEFLNPKFLGTREVFKQLYMVPIEQRKEMNKINQLKQLIDPFILRRTKQDKNIAADLPEKLEQKQYCKMTLEQETIYQSILEQVKEESKKLNKRKRNPYMMMMMGKLKQLCDHPSLYLKEEMNNFAERSNKVVLAEELINSILEANESVLLFTQYVQMGEWLQQHFSDTFNREVLYLHGSTSQESRSQMVKKFQEKRSPIFILSLQAGGTGLNLTAANHIIHFDRWWNPAVENQATDRVHRIGQQKTVQVHKLITVGTLEEKIDNILTKKQQLSISMLSTPGIKSVLEENIEDFL